ncbi:Rib/alpha-like domain-containing protein [Staphylococcus pseudintermedius]|nr:Rib/alpha-like domain-containing protein [Staphylococcus pseudintermedius]
MFASDFLQIPLRNGHPCLSLTVPTTKPAPADATPGTSVDIPVKVTYPDGSSEETPVKVTVDTPDSGNHDPGYEEGHTKPNVPVEVPQKSQKER